MGRTKKSKDCISIADDDVHSIMSDNDTKSTKTSSSEDSYNKIIKVEDFSSKETYYYKSIDKFFKNSPDDLITKMIDIIDKDSDISLRILDWFVTRYSNKYNVSYKINPTDEDDFNVHISYKAQLKSYKKKYFDPFRRRTKFNYTYIKDNKTKTLLTTIGQLNFFRWAFLNGVVKYVEQYHKVISKAMNKSNKEDKKRKSEKRIKPEKKVEKIEKKVNVDNKDIDIVAKKKINGTEVKIILTFD